MQISDDINPSVTCKTTNESEYLYLPVLLFEAIHLSSYNLEFIRNYVKISIKLEIENLASNQFNREAFSNDEINCSKQISNLVAKYQKLLEDIWKESRWIIDCISNARDKTSSSPSYLIQFNDLKRFFKNLIEKIENKKSSTYCCTCKSDTNNNNLLDLNTFNKKNIYNQITQLPNSNYSKCNCKSSNNFKCHHIDSILIDDDEEQSNFTYAYSKIPEEEFDGSIEDLTLEGKQNKNKMQCNVCLECLKNCGNNCQDSISLTSEKAHDESSILLGDLSGRTVHRLVSKLYISAPTTNENKNTSNASLVSSTIKEQQIESPMSTMSSSSGYYSNTSKYDSNLSSPSNYSKDSWQYPTPGLSSSSRKLNIFVDFNTGLKIDIHFECVISTQTTVNDLIYQMIKKINSFIESYNQANRNFIDNEEVVTFGKKRTPNCLNLLDESTHLYCLIVCVKTNTNNYSNNTNEKILSNDLIISCLKEPWINGIFYLRNNTKTYVSKKPNLV